MSAIFSQKWIGFTIKALLTLGLIWLVLSNQDLGRLSERLYSMTFWSIALALALLFFQAILAAVRWFIVMRLFGKVLPFQTVLRFYFEALLFNQALPSTIGGDGVRICQCSCDLSHGRRVRPGSLPSHEMHSLLPWCSDMIADSGEWLRCCRICILDWML